MGIQTFKARVAENLLLVGKFQHVHFELIAPARIEFEAGQYLLMKVPGAEKPRHYSICSPPAKNHSVETVVDISPHGEGSVYLASLSPGDEVEFMAPAGRFLVAELTSAKSSGEAREDELWLVATGSGISPIRSMILDLLIEKKDKRPIWLHWGLRHADDVFWFDEFAQLAEEHDNFTFDLVLSQPPEDWKLCKGHTTECVLKHHDGFSKIGAYLCGNKKMIDDVTATLIEKGVGREKIHKEEFY